MLFQDDLLFDHLTVAENLMFGMPATIKGKHARREKALTALAQVALADQADKLPQLLSGGQRARVSLLRALLAEPDALLLDEPFSRLDKPLRAAFRQLVFAQIKALAIPAILVTHDAKKTRRAPYSTSSKIVVNPYFIAKECSSCLIAT